MIRQCLAGAAAFAMIASAAPAQTASGSNGPSALSNATVPQDTPKSKARHHHKKPVETYEWSEDTWTETHPVAPPVVERSTTVVQPAPMVTTTRTTTTTESER